MISGLGSDTSSESSRRVVADDDVAGSERRVLLSLEVRSLRP